MRRGGQAGGAPKAAPAFMLGKGEGIPGSRILPPHPLHRRQALTCSYSISSALCWDAMAAAGGRGTATRGGTTKGGAALPRGPRRAGPAAPGKARGAPPRERGDDGKKELPRCAVIIWAGSRAGS